MLNNSQKHASRQIIIQEKDLLENLKKLQEKKKQMAFKLHMIKYQKSCNQKRVKKI